MSIYGQSHAAPVLERLAWQNSEALSDLLAEESGIEQACRQALEFILYILQAGSGGVLVQRAGEREPLFFAGKAVPAGWQAAFAHPDPALEAGIQAILQSESPSGDRSSCLREMEILQGEQPAWAAPLTGPSGNQGLVILFGERISAAAEAHLSYLVRPLARALMLLRSQPPAPQAGIQTAELKTAQADLEVSRTELMRSRNTLRVLFDSLPPALYIIDRDFKLSAVNRSRAQRAGKLPQELVGRLCYSALYGLSAPCPNCRVTETLMMRRITERTARQWGLEDEPFEWEIRTFPVCDDQGQVLQAVILEQDVTENRRLESILAQSEKLAAVGEMAASLAHEINNPLTAILANAQLLQRELPAGSDLKESADLIARAGARANQVVRNLLDFARRDPQTLERIDLNDNIQQAVALAQHELQARSIRLSFHPAPDLPLTLAAPDHLIGVWLNLLINAIDAIEQDGAIQVSALQQGQELCVKITDNGRGISPDKLVRIFEPFYTTKAPGRGTGLGLSVCQRIIHQHGGRIEVDSQPGVGSEFSVFLPIR